MLSPYYCTSYILISIQSKICFVSLVAMGSYNKFKNSWYKDAFRVSCINCGTSVFCGFFVFSLFSHMLHTLRLWNEDVAKSGPRLVFAVYSNDTACMPIAHCGPSSFFLIMIILGLDSAMIKVVISFVIDQYPKYFRKLNVWIRKLCFQTKICCMVNVYFRHRSWKLLILWNLGMKSERRVVWWAHFPPQVLTLVIQLFASVFTYLHNVGKLNLISLPLVLFYFEVTSINENNAFSINSVFC